MRPVLQLVVVVLVAAVRGMQSHCWEHHSCQDVQSESSMKECLSLCQTDSHEISLIFSDIHLHPLPSVDPASLPPSSPEASTSYSMEHFRWGKPLWQKRQPIKSHTLKGVRTPELLPTPRELSREIRAARNEEEEKLSRELHDKNDSPYKMKHFRWSGPMASKRYGGFMVKGWDEHSKRPLLTLFRNVINSDAEEEKREQ